MEKVGSLWKRKSKDGKQFLSGTMLGGLKVMIYPTKSKQSDKSPDYQVLIEYPGVEPKKFISKKEERQTVTYDDL